MYNNLIFLSNPVNGAQLLMQLTLWTFSVNSIRDGYNAGIKKEEILLVFFSLIRIFASDMKRKIYVASSWRNAKGIQEERYLRSSNRQNRN